MMRQKRLFRAAINAHSMLGATNPRRTIKGPTPGRTQSKTHVPLGYSRTLQRPTAKAIFSVLKHFKAQNTPNAWSNSNSYLVRRTKLLECIEFSNKPILGITAGKSGSVLFSSSKLRSGSEKNSNKLECHYQVACGVRTN
jgi:hypothetical protein